MPTTPPTAEPARDDAAAATESSPDSKGVPMPPPLGPVLEGALARFDKAIEDLARAAELLGTETGELAGKLRDAARPQLCSRAKMVAQQLAAAGSAIRQTRQHLRVGPTP